MSSAAATAANGAKRAKMGKTIGTHSGTFHCDEALGCYLLQQTAKFKGADIVRTRDPEVLKDLDVVIDVGGVYDPSKSMLHIIESSLYTFPCFGRTQIRVGLTAPHNFFYHRRHHPQPPVASSFAGADRFDHHQRGFTEVFGHGFNTKLSSAGLVYKHYGREIVASAMGLPVNHADVEAVYLAVYKHFMEAIDAIDNGEADWAGTISFWKWSDVYWANFEEKHAILLHVHKCIRMAQM